MSLKSTAALNLNEKTSSLTVRLDPKLKYGLEILSRKQHRNISSTVEWALNRILSDYDEGLPHLEDIWDVDEADRLIKLAFKYPELLSYNEQIVWKLIKENSYCWRYQPVSEKNIAWDRVRNNWDIFVAVAKGEKSKSLLPKLQEDEDEIPF